MNWYYDVISRYYPYNFLLALLSPASDSLSSLDSKLRHSAYAHLRVARAQCVYDFYFLSDLRVSDAVLSSQSIQAESWEQGQVLCPPEGVLFYSSRGTNIYCAAHRPFFSN